MYLAEGFLAFSKKLELHQSFFRTKKSHAKNYSYIASCVLLDKLSCWSCR